MRTNIVINDDVLAEALRRTKLRTKREVVDLALRRLVLLERQKDVLALEGSVEWEGDLDDLRRTRRSPDSG